jgi:hypothetical protein
VNAPTAVLCHSHHADGIRTYRVDRVRSVHQTTQEWLTTVPFAFRVAGGRELRAAVATLASRLSAALADQP